MKFYISWILLGLSFSSFGQVDQWTLRLDSPPTSVELFAPGIVSLAFNERDLAIAPDGKQLVFTRGDHKNSLRVLVSITIDNKEFTDPEILPFSGVYNDIEPFFSPDGKQLFFCSNRPMDKNIDRTDYNIWVVSKNISGWGEPTPLPEIINSTGDEFYPSVAASGNLYFTATLESGSGLEDIYLSKLFHGTYQQPESIGPAVNTNTYEFNAFVSPDESILIFSSYGRPDDMGGGDLYLSKKDEQGEWKPARHLTAPINSEALDYCPFVDFKHGAFYFTSQRVNSSNNGFESLRQFEEYLSSPANGMGDIYWVSMNRLNIKIN